MGKYTIRHDKNETKGKFLGDGKFALGFTLGLLAIVFALVFKESLYGEISGSEYLTIVPIVVSLLVAFASTFFSARALLEQKRAREASTDPVLVAHLGRREDARELVTFNISNVGAGAALNVQLEVDLPQGDGDDASKRGFVQDIFQPRVPFAVILQGERVEFNFALGWHLLGQSKASTVMDNLPTSPLPPFQVRLSYEDLAGGQYSSEFAIDVRELKGQGTHRSPQMRMVAALEAIAKKD